jgi:hypothetical protein
MAGLSGRITNSTIKFPHAYVINIPPSNRHIYPQWSRKYLSVLRLLGHNYIFLTYPQYNSMESGPPALKVAIPRLKTRDRDGNSPQRKARVEKACDICRTRKVRCSGERPQCRNCVDFDLHCNYAQSRKDRLKEFVFRTLGLHL